MAANARQWRAYIYQRRINGPPARFAAMGRSYIRFKSMGRSYR